MTRRRKTYGDCDDDVDGRRNDNKSCGGRNCDDDETKRKTSRTKNDACEKYWDDEYETKQLLRQRYHLRQPRKKNDDDSARKGDRRKSTKLSVKSEGTRKGTRTTLHCTANCHDDQSIIRIQGY